MATTDRENQINKIYDSQLSSQKESLTQSYNTAASNLNQEKQTAQRATDANLTRTAVENQKAQKNYAEIQTAYGLTSGAMAQAKMASDNQLQADLTALRTQQQQADQAIEQRKTDLRTNYESAIREAQAANDSARALQLYNLAKEQDAQLRADKENAAKLAQSQINAQLAYGLAPDAATLAASGYSQQYINNLINAYNTQKAETQDKEDVALARKQVDYLVSVGMRPSDALIQKSGYDQSYIDNGIRAYRMKNEESRGSYGSGVSSGGSSSSSRGGGGNPTANPGSPGFAGDPYGNPYEDGEQDELSDEMKNFANAIAGVLNNGSNAAKGAVNAAKGALIAAFQRGQNG